MPRKVSQTKDPHGRDEECVDQTRLVGDRDDVAIADGRDGDHREIEDVRDGDVAVDLVPQAVAVEQEDDEHRRDQQQHEAGTQQQRDFGGPRGALDQERQRIVAPLGADAAHRAAYPAESNPS